MEQDLLSDEKLQLITGQIVVGQTILAAYKLGLFDTLLKYPQISLHDLSQHLKLTVRSIQAMIACAGSMDFVEFENNGYQLSDLGRVFFDKSKKTYYGAVLDLLIQQSNLMNYDVIQKSILESKAQVAGNDDLFSDTHSVGNTESFVDALYEKAFAPAFFWTKILKFDNSKLFIDLGGGSGIHTIAACLANTDLKGIVCDREKILPFARKYIKKFNLEKQITTQKLDMWNDEIPVGDVLFLGDIFHDWTPDKCLFLAKKCYQSLRKGGKIVLHEMLFNDDKTGPFLTAAYNMKMMLWTEGQQFSETEIKKILQEAGFSNIHIKKSLGNWSLIIGDRN